MLNLKTLLLLTLISLLTSACGPKPCSESVKKASAEYSALQICQSLIYFNCTEFKNSLKGACETSGLLQSDCKISEEEMQALGKQGVTLLVDKLPLMKTKQAELEALVLEGLKKSEVKDGSNILTTGEFKNMCTF